VPRTAVGRSASGGDCGSSPNHRTPPTGPRASTEVRFKIRNLNLHVEMARWSSYVLRVIAQAHVGRL
jgi:hypothetical protein